MKKLLLGITGISLLLIFVMASCESGSTDVTSTSQVALQTLAAPASVTATAFGETGVIRVTWDAVENAKSYDVYRKSVAPKGGETAFHFKGTVAAESNGNGGYLGIEDIISTTNEFKPDVAYTYKVVALSSWSSYTGGASPAIWNPTSDLALQNSSKNSNEVKFDDPTAKNPKNPLAAVGTQLPAPEFTLGTVKTYATTGYTENLQVSWDVLPGVNYFVYYSYGSDVLNPQFANSVTPTAGQTKALSTFPLINGRTNVQLVAQHRSTGNYYLSSDLVSQNYEGAKTLLPNVTGFSANRTNQVVSLQWTDSPVVESYEVYRFTGTTNGYASGGYIFDDWENITTQINAFKDGTTWKAYDTDLNDENQAYVYMIIAKNGDAKSLPVTAYVANPVAAPVPIAINLGWDDNLREFKGIQITWDAGIGQTYRLYRKTVNYDLTSSVIIGPKTGTWDDGWDEITGFTAVPNNVQANYAVVDKPAAKDSYKYKLETTQGGLKAEKFADVTSSPYITDAALVLLEISDAPDVAANTAADTTAGWTSPKNRGTAYTIGVKFSDLGNARNQLAKILGAGDTVKIYRAKSNASGDELGSYVEVTLSTSDLLAGKQLIDTPPEPAYYKYKAEVVSGGKALRNTATNNGAYATAYTSAYTPTLTLTTPTSIGTTTVGRRFEYTSSTRTEYIAGTKLILKYIDLAAAPTLESEWDAATVVELTYTRTLVTTPAVNSASANLYYTDLVSTPDPAATTTRYYRLFARDGSGDIVTILGGDSNTITAVP